MTPPDAATLHVQLAPPRPRFNPLRAAGWIVLLATLAGVVAGGYLTWRWANDHLFSLGIQNGEQVHVDSAALLDRVRAFEVVTVRDTYDTRSNTEFRQRLNAGLATFDLPGWLAGQELDVHARVTVAAGVDLADMAPDDISVDANSGNATVTVRIPEAQVTSTEVYPDSFNISTRSGILTRARRTLGLGEKDVRDEAVGAVTSVARDEALRQGILQAADIEARSRLQGFLHALPQPAGGGHVTYIVETQAAPR